MVALLLSLAAMAADLSGIWVGQIPPGRPGANPQEIAFKFVQNGGSLNGKLYGDYKSTPLIEGKVTGESLTFIVVAEEQAGNQINETRLKFTGALRDGEIELTRERESSTNAGNGGVVQFRGNTKQTIRLKRLI